MRGFDSHTAPHLEISLNLVKKFDRDKLLKFFENEKLFLMFLKDREWPVRSKTAGPVLNSDLETFRTDDYKKPRQ